MVVYRLQKGKAPGMYPFDFHFSNLEDYLIYIDSPGRDLAIINL